MRGRIPNGVKAKGAECRTALRASGILHRSRSHRLTTRYGDEQNAETYHRHPSDACHARTVSPDPLDQDEDGHHGDPDEVHDAYGEEHGHECPAAAEAVDAVPKSHPERA